MSNNYNQTSISSKSERGKTQKLVLLSVMAAIAYICVFVFRIPVVSFLKYEPKDVILVIAGFLFGPMEAVLMSLVVSLIEMVTISDTGPIGLLMNVLSSAAFAGIAALFYQKKRTLFSAVLGLICGTIIMTGLMLLWNYFITPIYLMTPRDVVAEMLIPVFLPFNLLKGGINTAVTLLIYKPVVNGLRKSHLLPPRQQEELQKRSDTKLVLIGAGLLLASCAAGALVLGGVL